MGERLLESFGVGETMTENRSKFFELFYSHRLASVRLFRWSRLRGSQFLGLAFALLAAILHRAGN